MRFRVSYIMILAALMLCGTVRAEETSGEISGENSERNSGENIQNVQSEASPEIPSEVTDEVPSGVTLRECYAPFFRIGTAVSPFQLRDEALTEHIARQFSSLTAENCMKPDAMYRDDGNYSFREADILVEFAQKHDMAVRGHTLVWHSQTPRSFFLDASGNRLEKQALYDRLERYMTAVFTHFQGKVACWDVVNEVIADGGPEPYRTQSPWYEICGKEYIAEAFRLARKIAPDARLYYNDYGLISPEKRTRALQMLRELKDAGVPIDGVGIQAHWNVETFNPQELQNSIDAFSQLGLDVQITELDMSIHSFRSRRDTEVSPVLTPEMEEKQAEKYAQAFEVLRRNADKISSVTFWGVSDRFTWLSHFPVRNRKDFPLLFDENLQPKRAFQRVTEF